jgi:hypothetical protein
MGWVRLNGLILIELDGLSGNKLGLDLNLEESRWVELS